MTDPLSISVSVIAVLQLSAKVIDFTYGFLAAGKEAQTAVTNLRSELHDLEALLLSLQALLDDHASASSSSSHRLDEYNAWLQECHNLLSDFIVKLSPPASKLKQIGDRLRWPLREKDMLRLTDIIKQRKSSVAIGLALDQTNTMREIKDDTSHLRHREEEGQRAEIFRWLVPHNVEVEINYDSARHKCLEGTGKWFLTGNDFVEWKAKNGASLWLHGIPGSGKTILSGTIINALQSDLKSDPSVGLAFFFFTFSESEKQMVSNMLATLVKQLSAQLPQIPEALITLWNKGGKPSTEALLELFGSILKGFNRTYVILDALDEVATHERETLGRILGKLLDGSFVNLNTLLTSRREQYIVEALTSLSIAEVTMNSSAVDADISLFVSDILLKDSKLKKWDSKIKTAIETALVNGAQGMFRWVECQLESLKACRNGTAVKKALSSLPRTLDETYDRILLAIPDDDADFARTALTWLAFSAQPLTIDELAEAVIVKPGSRTVDLDDRFPEPSVLLEICGCLISTVYDGDKEVMVGLAHYSVMEYLTSDRVQTELNSRFCFTAQTASSLMSEVCLTYFAFKDFHDVQVQLPSEDRDSPVPPIINQLLQEYPLLGYAACYWDHHVLLKADGEERKQFENAAVNIISGEGSKFHIWRWIRSRHLHCHHHRHQHPLDFPAHGSPLFYFSLLGLETGVKLSINQGADVNAGIVESVTALVAAARGGHENIVQLLLANGAHVEAPQGVGCTESRCFIPDSTALQEALMGGHDKIACLMIERGAKVNIEFTPRADTPLMIAVGRDNEQMVHCLLENGADPNLRILFGFPLALASEKGNVHIVQLLLKYGALVNLDARCEWHFSAIASAVVSGNEELVDLLIAAGCDINGMNDLVLDEGGVWWQCTALHALSHWESHGRITTTHRREQAIYLLRKRGAEMQKELKPMGHCPRCDAVPDRPRQAVKFQLGMID